MDKKSMILGSLTLLVCIWVPLKLASYINLSGAVTGFKNKYLVFGAVLCIASVGSIFWRNMVEKNSTLSDFPVLQNKVKSYFSFLMLLSVLLILIIPYSIIVGLILFLGGHMLYIIYLFV